MRRGPDLKGKISGAGRNNEENCVMENKNRGKLYSGIKDWRITAGGASNVQSRTP